MRKGVIYAIIFGFVLLLVVYLIFMKLRPVEGPEFYILAPETLMANYKGERVTISGYVFSKVKGPVLIMVSDEKSKLSELPPGNITEVAYPNPRKYRLQVPKNCGKVYIEAVIPVCNAPNVEPPIVRASGSFSRNPLEIRGSDVENVNIFLSKTQVQ